MLFLDLKFQQDFMGGMGIWGRQSPPCFSVTVENNDQFPMPFDNIVPKFSG